MIIYNWLPDILEGDSPEGYDVVKDLQVEGIMAPYVGKQFSPQELWFVHCDRREMKPSNFDDHKAALSTIRAFEVPQLIGVQFFTTKLKDFRAALLNIITHVIPEYDWDGANFETGLIRKYGLFHEMIVAPFDDATHQPMGLELYGRLQTCNEITCGRLWLEQFGYQKDYSHIINPASREEWYINLHTQEKISNIDDLEIGTMRFEIFVATYSNTLFPSIGVPFYM